MAFGDCNRNDDRHAGRHRTGDAVPHGGAERGARQIVLGRLAGAVGVVRAQHGERVRPADRERNRHERRKQRLQRHRIGGDERDGPAAKTARIHGFL